MEAEFCVFLKYTDQTPATGLEEFCNTAWTVTFLEFLILKRGEEHC